MITLKKNFKKIIIGCAAICTCMTSVLSLNITSLFAANSDNSFEFTNVLYDEFNEMNKSSKSYNVVNYSDDSIFDYSDHEIEGLKVKSDSTSVAQISKDKTTGEYIYTELSTNSNSMAIETNNNKYIFTMEGENIYMTDDSGKKIIVSEMIYEDTPKYTINGNIEEVDPSIQTRAWSKEYGPFYKTNKSLVKILNFTSEVSGLISLIVQHPVLGTITLVTSAAGTILDSMYVTLYIKFYQRMDGTKVKERQRWYQNSDYTGFIKERTITFDSVRPDY